MTWFKVDDKFHSHAKVARLGDDSDALALWVVAGSWCADQLTDGWVPAYVARKLDPDYARRAATLVRVGLWEEAERDNEKGWVFHGWNEEGRQPTAEQVAADRKANAERQARWRERANEKRRNAVTDGVTNASPVTDVTDPVTPTRPDPTRPNTDSLRSSVEPPDASLRSASPPEGGTGKRDAAKRQRGTRIPDDFAVTADMVAWARENAPNVDGRRETERFINYWRGVAGGKGVKLDWVATWRNWLLKAEDDAITSGRITNPAATERASPRPPHCGKCDPNSRMLLDDDWRPIGKCPDCHPLTQKASTT